MYNDTQEQSRHLETLGRFAGGVAHDFNNILSVIEDYAGRALRAGTPDAASLEKIVDAARHGAGITRQLLTFARQDVAPESACDLAAVLRAQAPALDAIVGPAGIRLDMRLPARPLWVAASPRQVAKIAVHLALNARDAVRSGGVFTVSCSAAPDGSVALEFSDTGPGIPPAILPRVFEPMCTTHPAGYRTGLGLSVVYGVVTQAGGSIVARNLGGAVFDIRLPSASPVEAREAPLAGHTILLAEGEPETRSVLALMLEGMNLTVLTASNGNHALALQEEYGGTIDLLLADITTFDGDGAALAGKFSIMHPRSGIVCMGDDESLCNFGLPPGASFISKPFQEEKLRKILERALVRRDTRLGNAEKT